MSVLLFTFSEKTFDIFWMFDFAVLLLIYANTSLQCDRIASD